MRRLWHCLAGTGLVVLLGCAERAQVETTTRTETTQNGGTTVETTDRKVEHQVEHQTDPFEVDVKRKMDDLDKSIAKLKDRAHELKEEARPEWERQMANLSEARERARQELANLQSQSKEAWKDAKPGLQAAWDNLQQAYDNAAKHFESTPAEKRVEQTGPTSP